MQMCLYRQERERECVYMQTQKCLHKVANMFTYVHEYISIILGSIVYTVHTYMEQPYETVTVHDPKISIYI